MGAITPFQRNRLASSAVGTPGVSTAGAALGEAVAGFGAGLAKGAFGELATLQEAQAKQSRRINEVSQGNRALRQSLAFRNEAQTLHKSVLKAGGSQADLDVQLNDLRDSFLTDDDDPIFSSNFSKEANGHIKGISGNFFRANQKKQLIGIVDDMNGTADEAARMVSDEFSDPGSDPFARAIIMEIATEKTDESIAKNEGQLDAGVLAAFKKEKNNALLQAAVNGLMDHSPEEIDAFLDSEQAGLLALDGDVSDEDKTAIRKEAAQFQAAKIRVAEFAKITSRHRVEQGFADKLTVDSSKVSMTDIHKALVAGEISKSFATDARALKKSAGDPIGEGDPFVYGELLEEMRLIGKEKGTGAAKRLIVNDKVTFEQLALFRSRIMQSQAGKKTTPSQAAKLMDLISPKFNESMEEMVDNLNKVTVGADWVWALNNFVGSGKTKSPGTTEVPIFAKDRDVAQFRTNLTNELFRRIAKAQQNGRISYGQVKQITDDLTEKTQLDLTQKGFYQLGEIVSANEAAFRTLTGGQTLKGKFKTRAEQVAFEKTDLGKRLAVIAGATGTARAAERRKVIGFRDGQPVFSLPGDLRADILTPAIPFSTVEDQRKK